jgi:hypothetical protein
MGTRQNSTKLVYVGVEYHSCSLNMANATLVAGKMTLWHNVSVFQKFGSTDYFILQSGQPFTDFKWVHIFSPHPLTFGTAC